ncbi:uncharacterized protein G2W53_041239 [Senna tora]|uniref:Uncharacterized protein n=1 Tax=Senna tora TaxID=362788 RepID=A0A834VXT2_9FABA|nr:uncharacterized protein G2W53_041239 [Senna tora]
MEGAWIMSQHISDEKSRLDFRNGNKVRVKILLGQVSETDRFVL